MPTLTAKKSPRPTKRAQGRPLPELIFGDLWEFDPSPESREVSKQSFLILAGAVQRCMDLGVAARGDAAQIAHILWGTLHGLISLELFGYMPPSVSGEARLEHALTIMRDGLVHPLAPN